MKGLGGGLAQGVRGAGELAAVVEEAGKGGEDALEDELGTFAAVNRFDDREVCPDRVFLDVEQRGVGGGAKTVLPAPLGLPFIGGRHFRQELVSAFLQRRAEAIVEGLVAGVEINAIDARPLTQLIDRDVRIFVLAAELDQGPLDGVVWSGSTRISAHAGPSPTAAGSRAPASQPGCRDRAAPRCTSPAGRPRTRGAGSHGRPPGRAG